MSLDWIWAFIISLGQNSHVFKFSSFMENAKIPPWSNSYPFIFLWFVILIILIQLATWIVLHEIPELDESLEVSNIKGSHCDKFPGNICTARNLFRNSGHRASTALCPEFLIKLNCPNDLKNIGCFLISCHWNQWRCLQPWKSLNILSLFLLYPEWKASLFPIVGHMEIFLWFVFMWLNDFFRMFEC